MKTCHFEWSPFAGGLQPLFLSCWRPRMTNMLKMAKSQSIQDVAGAKSVILDFQPGELLVLAFGSLHHIELLRQRTLHGHFRQHHRQPHCLAQDRLGRYPKSVEQRRYSAPIGERDGRACGLSPVSRIPSRETWQRSATATRASSRPRRHSRSSGQSPGSGAFLLASRRNSSTRGPLRSAWPSGGRTHIGDPNPWGL